MEGLANECAATYGSELEFREDEDEALVAQAEKMKEEGAVVRIRLQITEIILQFMVQQGCAKLSLLLTDIHCALQEEQRLLEASIATFRAAQMWAQATMQPASADKQARVAIARVADRLDVLTGQGSGKEAQAELEKELARDERERKMDPLEQTREDAESLSKVQK